LKKTLTVTVDAKVYDAIEAGRGQVPRSTVVNDLLRSALEEN
jgi:hypothetical protein